MPLISDLPIGNKQYTQLSSTVLAVLSRRVDGWAVYIGAVPGLNHDAEWLDVARNGEKLQEPVALAIVKNYFHPGFEPGNLSYAR